MVFLLSLVFSPKLDLFLTVATFVAVLGLLFFFYLEVLRPYAAKTKPSKLDPPEEGDTFEVVVPESTRFYKFSVGQVYGNLPTLCKSIQDDHIVFTLKKSKDAENYDILVTKSGPALMKPPRMQYFGKMETSEKIESHEIIGQTASFRIGDKITKDRMTQYFEIGLTSAFFVTKLGQERMKFIFSVQKIHPGLAVRSRDKKGLYSFGKEERSEED
ncbi:hypothetical protein EHQ27_09845 [Leptospira wolffii]|uniref:hypothetical protein n=1 Tax=Leptospira wolffii TaxID=409998 RepID=UPI000349D397|nr:hypothetical protein [Leptospira wolffii]TGK56830.1 hypothetical protein EHQ32_14685 [Leptospira wolffii]TGK71588.1 hypothetical protein EHQ27_09845 [Leptospira wolffii]TGK75555.1 hypothetical protein EHQ35_04060 [Leptospira wolffii]TGL32955.1 hypothetical protein EHQ57_00470 [Leptospira wolffii]